MNQQIVEKLQTLEADLRSLAGDSTNASFTITLDANGAHYSYTVSDNTGGAENYSKRIPTAKTA